SKWRSRSRPRLPGTTCRCRATPRLKRTDRSGKPSCFTVSTSTRRSSAWLETQGCLRRGSSASTLAHAESPRKGLRSASRSRKRSNAAPEAEAAVQDTERRREVTSLSAADRAPSPAAPEFFSRLASRVFRSEYSDLDGDGRLPRNLRE